MQERRSEQKYIIKSNVQDYFSYNDMIVSLYLELLTDVAHLE